MGCIPNVKTTSLDIHFLIYLLDFPVFPLHRFVQSPHRRPEGPYADMLAWAVEQARDWEAAAVAGEVGAAAALDPNYHMFTCDNRSAASFTIGVGLNGSFFLKILNTY